jgi:D-beta-D-heptose 7-phosphate kinase/D-beta-D-heptose 1-phosphate adenosyltransferase
MTLFREDHDPLTIATVAQEVFDVVGAGDTVVATLGVAVAAGLPLETATRLANIAAGIAVGKHGTVAVTAEELFSHSEVTLLPEEGES